MSQQEQQQQFDSVTWQSGFWAGFWIGAAAGALGALVITILAR